MDARGPTQPIITHYMKYKSHHLNQSKVCGKLFKSSGEEKALRSEKISLGKHSTSQSHCLARDLDIKKLAASNLPFQVFEGFKET